MRSSFNWGITLLTFTASILASSTVFAINDSWSIEQENNGISIASREIDGSNFREFRAEMTLETKIDTIISIFHDPNSFTQWVHQCSKAEIVQQNSFLDVIVYQVSNMPFLVTDRDIVIHDVYSYSNDYKEWTIDVKAIEGFVPGTDNVRITQSQGAYKLTQINDSEVKIVWTQHADPAGALPSWLVNSLIVDLPYETLNNLRELTKEEQYKSSKIGYDENGVPTHWAVKNF